MNYEAATGRPVRDRLRLGDPELAGSFLDTLGELDRRLAENELVIGVLAGDEARAFALDRVPEKAPAQDTIGGVPVVILEDGSGAPSLAYHRELTDGRVLDFERRDGAIYDVRTGSRWASGGLAVEGEMSGVQPTFVTSFVTEWYGWSAFHPQTSIYGEGP